MTSRFHFYCWLSILSLLLQPAAHANMEVDQVRQFYSVAAVPGGSQEAKLAAMYRDKREEFAAALRDSFVRMDLLPSDKVVADRYVERGMTVMGEYFAVVHFGSKATHRTELEAVANDPEYRSLERSIAAFVLYLDTGETNHAVQSIVLAPFRIKVFAAVPDPDFGQICVKLLAGAAHEEVLNQYRHFDQAPFRQPTRKGFVDGKPRPYSWAINTHYVALCKAIYYQNAPRSLARHLFQRLRYFQLTEGAGWDAIDLADLARTLAVTSPVALKDLISSLVESGFSDELLEVRNSEVPGAAPLLAEAAQERVQSLRREIDQLMAPQQGAVQK
jgi:hypothetical protein